MRRDRGGRAAEMIRGDWIAEGAVVLNVGIHRTADHKIVGDVVFASVTQRARAITPMRGGIGR